MSSVTTGKEKTSQCQEKAEPTEIMGWRLSDYKKLKKGSTYITPTWRYKPEAADSEPACHDIGTRTY